MAKQAEGRNTHYAHVDGLRALAALWVVVHHAFLTIWPLDLKPRIQPPDVLGPFIGWARYGHLPVSIFIVLSGYVLMLPVARDGGVLKRGPLAFFKARARRILPAYYASMALSLLLIVLLIGQKTGTHWDISIPVTKRGLFEHVLLVQNIYGNAEINHVYWSIAVECQIYLLFPILVLMMRRFGAPATTIVAAVVGYGLYFLLRETPYRDSTPYYLLLFVLGMCCATKGWEDSAKRWAKEGVFLLPSALIFLMIVYTCLDTSWQAVWTGYPLWDAVAAVGTVMLLTHLAHIEPRTHAKFNWWATSRPLSTRRDWAKAAFSWRPLVIVGTFSYSLYLIHAPLLQVIWLAISRYGMSDPATFFALLLLGTPMILLVSYGFFKLFEKPFMSSRQRTAVEAEIANRPIGDNAG